MTKVFPIKLTALPLTQAGWKPYGDVIQGADDGSSMPSNVITNSVKTATIQGNKFNRVSVIASSYPSSSYESPTPPVTAIAIARFDASPLLKHGEIAEIRMLEKHIASSQAFIPMATASEEWAPWAGDTGAKVKGLGGMLVVGCLPDAEGRPDLSTLKVFIASPSQGVAYHSGIWHHSLASFSRADYAVIDTQITTNSSLLIDCEILRKAEGEDPYALVQLPTL